MHGTAGAAHAIVTRMGTAGAAPPRPLLNLRKLLFLKRFSFFLVLGDLLFPPELVVRTDETRDEERVLELLLEVLLDPP